MPTPEDLTEAAPEVSETTANDGDDTNNDNDDADNDGDDEIDDDADADAPRSRRGERRRASASSRLVNLLPGSARFWSAATIVLLLASFLLLLGGHTDATFVLATLGLVAWFLNMRNRLHKDDVITGADTLERGEDEFDEHN